MRWVNDTFPPRPRPRWLLITMRLSTRSLAGTARTLVAVGTVRLAALFAAGRAARPPRPRAAPPRGRTSVASAGADVAGAGDGAAGDGAVGGRLAGGGGAAAPGGT